MEKFYNQIDQYISGDLSDEEKEAFETALQQDEALHKELQLQQGIIRLLGAEEGEPEFKAILNQLGAQKESDSNTIIPIQPKRNLRLIFIGAAVAIAAALLLLFIPIKPNMPELPSTNFPVMGDNDELLLEAGNAFNQKEYEKAIGLFKEYSVKNAEDTEALYFQALAHFQLNQFSEATNLFQTISQQDSRFKYQATFYLALTKHKQGDPSASINYFKQIPAGTDQFEGAQKWLKYLQ